MRPHFLQNRQAVVLIVISALALSVGVSSQQDKRASSGKPAFSLTIQAKDHTVKTGSPVWVDATEKNASLRNSLAEHALPSRRTQAPFSPLSCGNSCWWLS